MAVSETFIMWWGVFLVAYGFMMLCGVLRFWNIDDD